MCCGTNTVATLGRVWQRPEASTQSEAAQQQLEASQQQIPTAITQSEAAQGTKRIRAESRRAEARGESFSSIHWRRQAAGVSGDGVSKSQFMYREPLAVPAMGSHQCVVCVFSSQKYSLPFSSCRRIHPWGSSAVRALGACGCNSQPLPSTHTAAASSARCTSFSIPPSLPWCINPTHRHHA